MVSGVDLDNPGPAAKVIQAVSGPFRSSEKLPTIGSEHSKHSNKVSVYSSAETGSQDSFFSASSA